MGRGTVRWCDAVKGIGFKALDRDGNEVAVQSTAIKNIESPQAPPNPRTLRKRQKPSDA
ncbi:cold shock protein (beta-ribbon, CspA family) [Pseudomonas orientalis]|uniref:Cold shock protein (Beta-ribbon, CspA family) n=1 Tax=Pseudomonas orientalis TaxID=76758 RepID=A0A8B3XW11_9PSED|nr:cold shock protein (beta-ribbon, CspA family) [Pseudomonas orientalis]